MTAEAWFRSVRHDRAVLEALQNRAYLILGRLAQHNAESRHKAETGVPVHFSIDARHPAFLQTAGSMADRSSTSLTIDPTDLTSMTFDLTRPGQFAGSVTAAQLRPAFEFALRVALMGIDIARLRQCYATVQRQQGI